MSSEMSIQRVNGNATIVHVGDKGCKDWPKVDDATFERVAAS